MNPLNTVTRPVASGFRLTGRAMQLVADRLEQLAGAQQGAQEEAAGPSPQEAEIQRERSKSTGQPKPLDDVSITRKVETEIFRSPDVPKGSIDVNAVDGVVWLRGEAKTPEMINDLERRAAEVPEVKRVENLLHLPKTPAPSRADTPRRQQKTRRSRRSPAKRRTTTRVSDEQEASTTSEPKPKDVAGSRRGRPPAPLGGDGGSGGDAGS